MISEKVVEGWIRDLESRAKAAQEEGLEAKVWPDEYRAMAKHTAFLEAIIVLGTSREAKHGIQP